MLWNCSMRRSYTLKKLLPEASNLRNHSPSITSSKHTVQHEVGRSVCINECDRLRGKIGFELNLRKIFLLSSGVLMFEICRHFLRRAHLSSADSLTEVASGAVASCSESLFYAMRTVKNMPGYRENMRVLTDVESSQVSLQQTSCEQSDCLAKNTVTQLSDDPVNYNDLTSCSPHP